MLALGASPRKGHLSETRTAEVRCVDGPLRGGRARLTRETWQNPQGPGKGWGGPAGRQSRARAVAGGATSLHLHPGGGEPTGRATVASSAGIRLKPRGPFSLRTWPTPRAALNLLHGPARAGPRGRGGHTRGKRGMPREAVISDQRGPSPRGARWAHPASLPREPTPTPSVHNKYLLKVFPVVSVINGPLTHSMYQVSGVNLQEALLRAHPTLPTTQLGEG